MSTGTRSTIKYWWNLVAAISTSSNLKLLSVISSHKRGSLYAVNPREKESVDLKVARGRNSKLLLEETIDLRLNLIVKTSILY